MCTCAQTLTEGQAEGNNTATPLPPLAGVSMAAPLQEVVLGTHDSDNSHNNNGASLMMQSWDDHVPELPELAEVESHVASLRALVTNGGVPIEPTHLQLIDNIVDRLDQVYYWAAEEGTTFLGEPSQLAQCEVPQLTVLCIRTKRPKIVLAALRIMRHLLRHGQTGPQLVAAVAEKKEEEKNFTENADDEDLFGMLASVMEQHAGLSELQAEAAAVAAEAALIDIEGLLESPVISHVLAALERHGSSTAMQREGVLLFSTLVDIQRGGTPRENAATDVRLTPVAILLSHVGVVVRFVVSVTKAHAGSVDVKRNAVHFFFRCASYPENLELLLREGVYPVLVGALPSAVRVPELFSELTEAIAYFIPLLDPLQQRSLVLVLRRVLLETASPIFISLCVALLVRILQVEPRRGLPMPCQGMQPGLPQEAALNLCVRGGERTLSDNIHLGEGDIRVFMSSNFIPQLLCCAADTIGEDDAMLRRVVAEAIELLSPYRWR
ncbi:hypothetical protein MOQ_005619 [Trypanosoma cruzi marinkellei]|uniref:Uncharacterized protein n=1 Tax=Trypanosoma cruzi marinkellei TaxID=85056 RepID=K2NNX8_TRYCR|nr:hypothetical protein MOQ_005619 [Trypanosoma cruzi marinkellei]